MAHTMTRGEMVAHDEKTAALHNRAAGLQAALDAHRDTMHFMVSDRRERVGYGHLRPYWKMTGAQVLDQLRALIAEGDTFDPRRGLKPSEAISREGEKATALAEVMLEIAALEDTYRARPWPRFFPSITKSQPHIHRSLNCRTLYPDTMMSWAPSLSGKTEAEAVAELDEALCTVCFPSAPVALHEYVSKRSQADKAERDAEKVARMAAKAARELARGEQFRSEYSGDAVRTVAALKDLVRKAVTERVELEWWQSDSASEAGWTPGALVNRIRTMTGHLEQMERDATRAVQLLTARENENSGWGASVTDIARMRASAERRARKDWES